MRNQINNRIRSGMWSMVFDEKGKIQKVIWSRAFREMLGFQDTGNFPDKLEAWSDRLCPEDKNATLEAYWAAVWGKQNYDVEYRLLTKDLEYHWFRDTGEVIRREDGSPGLFIGTAIDITQARENERLTREWLAVQAALEETRSELEKRNEILSALCADYVAVYWVDLGNEQFEACNITGSLRADVKKSIEAQTNYVSAMEIYIDQYVAEEDRKYVRAMVARERVTAELKQRENYYIRYRVKDNPEGVKNFEVLFANAGGVLGGHTMIAGFRNVDSVVRKEDTYRMEARHDVEETLEGARTGLWVIECENGSEPRLYADKTMRMLLGVGEDTSPEDCYQIWIDGIEPEYVEMVQESVQETLQKGRSEVSYPWNHPSLGLIYIRCGGICDKKFEKEGYRVKGYHQDITETMLTSQRQEKALMDALLEAKRASTAKTEFLSHMSHDIRTPINGILGMLSISEKNPGNAARQKECRAKIRTSAEHLLSLINDVLDISKLESGAFVFEKERFYLEDVLDSCISIMAPQAEEQGIAVEEKRMILARTALIGSPLHLRQILINIVGNAVKYNKPNGKIIISIEELPEKEYSTYRFTIEDTGIGMSEEFQKHLFEPFTQEQNDARTSYRGTGLGMAITKSLVEQMGGTIFVKSELGRGSIFTVVLPVERAAAQEEEIRQAEEVHVDVSGMKVLLVEDNEINREIAQYMLEDAGVTVVNAENGRIAVDLFAASPPDMFDCILMDVMMPVMDGLEATRMIRGMERSDAKTVPVIALSANAFAEDAQMAREAGMNEHLAKPLDMDQVFGVMASCRKTKEDSSGEEERKLSNSK